MLVGILAAFCSAALGALIYAFLTVSLQANQNVTGLALTIFGNGVYLFVGRSLAKAGNFPLLSNYPDLAEKVMDKGIPVLRDIPYIGKLLFSYNIFVYVAIVVAIIMWVYVMRTKTGLITGLGGLYLAFVINGGSWNEFWINGMGWIAVALVIFANWNPMKAIFGSFFFGMFNVLMAWKGNLSATFPRVLGWLRLIPDEFYQLLPFLITAVVLVFASVSKKKKSAEPAAVGVNYFREER